MFTPINEKLLLIIFRSDEDYVFIKVDSSMKYLCNRELSIKVHHLTPFVSPLIIEGVNGHTRLTQPQAV